MADVTLLPVCCENPEVAETEEEADRLAETMGSGVQPEHLDFYTFVVACALGKPQDQVAFRVARALNMTKPGCMGMDLEVATYCLQWIRTKRSMLVNGPDALASALDADLSAAFVGVDDVDDIRAAYVVATVMHANAVIQGRPITVIKPDMAVTILRLLLRGDVSAATKQARALEKSCPDYGLLAMGSSMDAETFLLRVQGVDLPTLRVFARNHGLLGRSVFQDDDTAALPPVNSGEPDAWEAGEAMVPRLNGITLEALWHTYASTRPSKDKVFPLVWSPVTSPDGIPADDGDDDYYSDDD